MFNILVGIYDKMTINYDSALLLVRYLLSEIDLSLLIKPVHYLTVNMLILFHLLLLEKI